jgi:hypothetical protein
MPHTVVHLHRGFPQTQLFPQQDMMAELPEVPLAVEQEVVEHTL